MSATLPGPLIDIEVCLGVGTIQPGGVWDSGAWDYNTWQETDTVLGDWTDVTCWIPDGTLKLAAGSSSGDGVVTRWEAQTCAFTLIGAQFDPRTGPYTGLLGPALPVRVRWRVTGDPEWLTAFVGQVTDDGFAYDPKAKRATVTATDGAGVLAAYDGLEQAPQGAGEVASARVARIADMAGWPVDLRDITDGGVTLKSTTLAQSAWTLLLAVADTDLAILWINRAGELAYRPLGKVLPPRALSAIIGCHVENPGAATVIEPVTIEGQQPTITRNIVSISRQSEEGATEAATVTLRDEPSISRFLAHSYSRTDLLHTDDEWSTTVAQAVLMSSAWPATAPATVELDSRADLASSALLLGLEPSLSVAVTENGETWQCEPAGWDIEISRARIAGTVSLVDVSVWFGGAWDDAQFDIGSWGF
jgi:hypothetical protein